MNGVKKFFLGNKKEFNEIISNVKSLLVKKLAPIYNEGNEHVKKKKELFRSVCEISLMLEFGSEPREINIELIKKVLDDSIEFINEEIQKYSKTKLSTLPVDLNSSVHLLGYTMDKLIFNESKSQINELEELIYRIYLFKRDIEYIITKNNVS